MTLEEIKTAIADGEIVHWANHNYTVILTKFGDYLIRCKFNDHCTGLTWQDGVTMNEAPEDFFCCVGE